MYEFLDSAVNILFLVCAAATFVTILAKRAKDTKEKSKDDENK